MLIFRASTTVIFEETVIVMLFANRGVKFTMASTFGLISLGTLSATWQSNCCEGIVLGLLGDVPVTV